MTNVEQAKLSRNAGLGKFLTDNAAVFASDNAFNALTAKFTTDAAAAVDSAAKTGLDNKGFSQDKVNAKIAAGHLASALCGSAQVKLEDLGKLSIAHALHDAETYYTDPADGEAVARLQAAHGLMLDNQGDITDDYVTIAELKQLQKLINTYIETDGSSEAAHATSPAATAQFKSDLKVTDKDVKNFLKLVKKYKLTNNLFYNGILAACELPAIAIRHTTFDVTLHDKVSGDAIAGATCSLSNSKTAFTSDKTGFANLDHVGAGNPSLTIEATGYKTYSSLVHIVSGKENSFTILLEKA